MEIDIIGRIITLEWDMFQKVQSTGGPASCQGDRQTFEIMRRSQFESWTNELNTSYLSDLNSAMSEGRNLLTEKYARMMESTHPDEYEAIASSLPEVGPEIKDLANSIAKQMADAQAALSLRFPHVALRGRPTYSSQDSPFVTSIETYLRGEFLTYSKKTLLLLQSLLDQTDIAYAILLRTVSKYGYHSLEEAEDYFSDKSGPKNSTGFSETP